MTKTPLDSRSHLFHTEVGMESRKMVNDICPNQDDAQPHLFDEEGACKLCGTNSRVSRFNSMKARRVRLFAPISIHHYGSRGHAWGTAKGESN